MSVGISIDLRQGPMRTHGTLTRWNDERGFGFIAPAHIGDEIFVHVSAFPRDGMRPQVSELVSFDVEAGTDGKKRAVRVMRPGSRNTSRRHETSTAHPAYLASILIAVAVGAGAIGSYAYRTFAPGAASPSPSADAAETGAMRSEVVVKEDFHCDSRTRCSQMTSCAEATYFLQHCPDTTMDGDRDGVPCETQWCH